MTNFTERLRDYGLTLEEDVIICDRRVVDEAADMIDELEQALRAVTNKAVELENSVACAYGNFITIDEMRQGDWFDQSIVDAESLLNKLERL